ncbi:hypothetical protein Sango_0361800 [Sesamum angolense]|uniref:Uncharacterized protein n=1 Tax=Sesamum angolense TaxID=2727404 RepID=A0AAE2C3N4_9LAMI|nr:hypothetical protein Sango_0361800 [Sesamum angolense]
MGTICVNTLRYYRCLSSFAQAKEYGHHLSLKATYWRREKLASDKLIAGAQEKLCSAEEKIKLLEEQVGRSQAKLTQAKEVALEAGRVDGFSVGHSAVKGRRVKRRNFHVGDLVLKKVEVSKHVGKLDLSWEGPYKVIEVKRKGTYQLQDMEGIASLPLVSTQLIGFGGSEVIPLGTIDLPVSMGTEPRRKTIMDFKGINSEAIVHRLNVEPLTRGVGLRISLAAMKPTPKGRSRTFQVEDLEIGHRRSCEDLH